MAHARACHGYKKGDHKHVCICPPPTVPPRPAPSPQAETVPEAPYLMQEVRCQVDPNQVSNCLSMFVIAGCGMQTVKQCAVQLYICCILRTMPVFKRDQYTCTSVVGQDSPAPTAQPETWHKLNGVVLSKQNLGEMDIPHILTVTPLHRFRTPFKIFPSSLSGRAAFG